MNPGVVEEAERQLESKEGPGQRLRTARMARNVELAGIANQLHLSNEVVAALEQDEYHKLPDPVFVRGYIRSYARLLGLQPEPLLEAYEAQLPNREQEPQLGTVRMKDSLGSSHALVRTVTILIVVGLGVLVAMWIGSDKELPVLPDTQSESREQVSRTKEPEPGRDEDDQAAVGASEQAPTRDPDPLPVAGPAAPAEVPVVELPVASTPVASPEPALVDAVIGARAGGPEAANNMGAEDVAGEPIVEFELLGPCWVDIRDANGQNRIIGELGKGARRTLRGEPPFFIVLGNSRVVRMSVNGEPYDLSAHAQGNVARFELDPAVTVEGTARGEVRSSGSRQDDGER